MADLAGLRVGFLTCYDVRFPELARALAAGGADLLVLPAAWAAGLFKEEHWVTLVRARAIENTIWVAAAGQVPDPAEPPTRAPTGVGRSLLVDPMGAVRTRPRARPRASASATWIQNHGSGQGGAAVAVSNRRPTSSAPRAAVAAR